MSDDQAVRSERVTALTQSDIEELRGQVHGGATLSDKHMNALCDLALKALTAPKEGLRDEAKPVAWVVQMLDDGSIGAELAVVGWLTFDKQMEKLQADAWVKAGKAKVAPLYAHPPAQAGGEAVMAPLPAEHGWLDSNQMLVAYDANQMVAYGKACVALARPTERGEVERTDKARLDWLELKTVNVRTPLLHGSRDLFWASPIDEEGSDSDLPSDLRKRIDAALAAQKGEQP